MKLKAREKPRYLTTMFCLDCERMFEASNVSRPCPICASREVIAAARWQPARYGMPVLGKADTPAEAELAEAKANGIPVRCRDLDCESRDACPHSRDHEPSDECPFPCGADEPYSRCFPVKEVSDE